MIGIRSDSYNFDQIRTIAMDKKSSKVLNEFNEKMYHTTKIATNFFPLGMKSEMIWIIGNKIDNQILIRI